MKKRKYTGPYLSRDYFPRDILPHTVYAGHKILRQPLPYRQQDEIMFLLVRGGTGTVTVNGRSFPAKRGSLFCFSPGHFHKIEPSKAQGLEVSECHMNTGLYFFITACPYYPAATGVSGPPVYARLDEELTHRTARVMEDIAIQCGKSAVSENQSLFFLLMKLFGIMERYNTEETESLDKAKSIVQNDLF